MHYFGNKVDLFGAAMRLPITPTETVTAFEGADPDQLGEMILRKLLTWWEDPEGLAVWSGLIRSAMVDEKAAQMLKEFLTSAVLQRIARTLGGADAEYRVSLVASQIVGLGVARYIVRIEPLASASTDELVSALAPNLQRYLTGDLGGDGR